MSQADVVSCEGKLPWVTIVTPTHNQADYLSETIESVLDQDYPNIEYIVIDDGSTDHTREILARYDGQIRWQSQENMGQAATLNKGWALGKGEYLGYLSSDDLFRPSAVSEAVSALGANPEAVLVYPDFALIDADGNFIRESRTPDYSHFDLTVNLVCQPGPGVLFRRKLFELVGGWNPVLRQIPDFEYWLRLSKYGPFIHIPRVLAASRIHEESQSFNILSVGRALEPVAVVDSYYESTPKRGAVGYVRRARGNARLLAARLLLRAGRPILGLAWLSRAVMIAPRLLFEGAFWRILLSGLVGKLFYRLRYRV